MHRPAFAANECTATTLSSTAIAGIPFNVTIEFKPPVDSGLFILEILLSDGNTYRAQNAIADRSESNYSINIPDHGSYIIRASSIPPPRPKRTYCEVAISIIPQPTPTPGGPTLTPTPTSAPGVFLTPSPTGAPAILPTSVPLPTATPPPSPTIGPPPLPPCEEWVDQTGKRVEPQPKDTKDIEKIEKDEDGNPTGIKVRCGLVDTGLGVKIPTDPVGFIKQLFTILLSLSGGIALILIMVSGYSLMFSQGNSEKLEGAKETLTSAIVGLLFIIFSLVILQVIGVDLLKIPGFEN